MTSEQPFGDEWDQICGGTQEEADAAYVARCSVTRNCCRYWRSMGLPCYVGDHRQSSAGEQFVDGIFACPGCAGGFDYADNAHLRDERCQFAVTGGLDANPPGAVDPYDHARCGTSGGCAAPVAEFDPVNCPAEAAS